jgi:hypothetical protein
MDRRTSRLIAIVGLLVIVVAVLIVVGLRLPG